GRRQRGDAAEHRDRHRAAADRREPIDPRLQKAGLKPPPCDVNASDSGLSFVPPSVPAVAQPAAVLAAERAMTPASQPAGRAEGLYPRPQLLASALRSNAFRTSIEGRSEIRADPRCERGLAAGVETLPDTSFLARAAATVSPRHSDAASETGCRFLF